MEVGPRAADTMARVAEESRVESQGSQLQEHSRSLAEELQFPIRDLPLSQEKSEPQLGPQAL